MFCGFLWRYDEWLLWLIWMSAVIWVRNNLSYVVFYTASLVGIKENGFFDIIVEFVLGCTHNRMGCTAYRKGIVLFSQNCYTIRTKELNMFGIVDSVEFILSEFIMS